MSIKRNQYILGIFFVFGVCKIDMTIVLVVSCIYFKGLKINSTLAKFNHNAFFKGGTNIRITRGVQNFKRNYYN